MSDAPAPTAAERKQQRLAAALRANLGKRKARAREAGIPSPAIAGVGDGDPSPVLTGER